MLSFSFLSFNVMRVLIAVLQANLSLPTPPTVPKTQMKLSQNIGLVEEDFWLACPFSRPHAYGFFVWVFLIQLIVVYEGWNGEVR